MEQNFFEVVEARTSIRHYDASHKISEQELKDILTATTKSPSAWNLQHWHFMVFTSDEAKQRLLPIAYNQNQVTEASAVVAVLGDLEANKNVDDVYNPLVNREAMTAEVKDILAGQINRAYENDVFARDAAFTNASLAAMTLMHSSKAKGYDTCAMGGFNAKNFVEEFKVSDRYLPVMLISIGKAAKEAHQSERFDLDRLTTWL
ncbi:nitroreductase family protein [Priestia endophytica]|uniref:Nitroreductase family protein n=1 Tax=Priestia endophytica TaxID=135735 RepID=A0AAX1Q2G2_9BACI|nr:nitroreductase family protein [Priestia endophytica]RAS72142.1 nitroreductase family protein [Priestia endophytica]RAS89778.1 nitroreductase family protein [Priestia endophytica]